MSDKINIDGVEYEEDEVVTLHNGDQCPIEDAVLVDNGNYEGEYLHIDDCTLTDLDGWVHDGDVITAEDGNTMCADNADDHDYHWSADGYLYHIEDLVWVEDEGEYRHVDDVGIHCFWHEDDGYYSYEENRGRGDGNYEYHDGPRNWFVDADKFRFGVEVEKEDPHGDVRDIWDLEEVTDKTGWAREHDGSLNDGFELVSPVYGLFEDKFDSHINGDDTRGDMLRDHINAGYHWRTCGGHMSFSIKDKRGSQVYDLYSGFFPLLLALYRKRMRKTYAKLKTSKVFKQGQKYSAICVHHNYIEFRVFSAVPNVDTLLWRRDLLRIMAKSPKKGLMWWIRRALNENSILNKHLSVHYSQDRIRELMMFAAAIAEHMTDKKYPNIVQYVDTDISDYSSVRSAVYSDRYN